VAKDELTINVTVKVDVALAIYEVAQAAQCLLEHAGHGSDAMPEDARYVGVRLVYLNALGKAMATFRRVDKANKLVVGVAGE